MQIDEQLYLCLQVDRADGAPVHVHAAPLSRIVFKTYWEPLSKTYNEILMERLIMVAPRVAMFVLEKHARAANQWEGPMGIRLGLLPELRRLTNVIAPSAAGWQPQTYEDAVKNGLIDEEDAEAIDNLLVFFTAVWHLPLRQDRKTMVEASFSMLSVVLISSLSLSEYAGSLPTLIGTVSSGATPQAPSSPPSSIGPPPMAGRPSSTIAQLTSPGSPPSSFAIAS